MSAKRVAALVDVPVRTYCDVYEPHLLRTGRIRVTPRGGVAVS
jgi:Holliday junction resolvasome RuvABC ATP-dependent DNA helicase subunit